MKKSYILLIVSLFGFSLHAQILDPASWQFEISKDNAKLGEVVDICFRAELDDTWQLYSNIQDYDLGPIPASFEFRPDDDYVLVGTVEPIDPKIKYEDVFEVNVNYFEGMAQFQQKVKVLGPNPIIRGTIEYQVCTTVDGKCINLEEDFEFQIKTVN